MREPRVVVVGAGAIGLSAAVHAAELGAAVTVLERTTPAAGSSGLSAGIFNRQAVDPVDVEIRVRAERFLTTLAAEHGLHLARNGYVRVASEEQHLRRYEAGLAVERALGVDDARLLDREGMRRLVPEMRCDDVFGGLYGPSDGHLDGPLLCGALVERGAARGVEHRFRCELLGAEEGHAGLTLHTSTGSLACDVVVNAAGPWAPAVGEILGAPAPICSERHQVCMVRLGARRDTPMPAVQFYVPGTRAPALYFRGEGGRGLLAGLHSYAIHDRDGEDPDTYRRTVDDLYVEHVASMLSDRLPGLPEAQLAGGWAGLYPISVDGIPQIGPYATRPGVVAAAGGGGVGLTLGLIYGQLAAEWAVLGKPRTVTEAVAFRPDRPSLAQPGAAS